LFSSFFKFFIGNSNVRWRFWCKKNSFYK
jgi:hypothetical protein